MTVLAGGVPLRRLHMSGVSVYVPGARSRAYEPSTPVTALATSRLAVSVATIVAPATGRGAHPGVGGSVTTGHVGPAVMWPFTVA
jgi:hypothetical protein